MNRKHFFKFSLAVTLLFIAGILFLYAINLHDNAKYGQAKTLNQRIQEVTGN